MYAKRQLTFSKGSLSGGTARPNGDDPSKSYVNSSIDRNKSSKEPNTFDIDDIDDEELERILRKHEKEKKSKLKRMKFNLEDYPQVDPDLAKTWIYPTNISERKYQFKICERALLINTLVCLPTGLGKFIVSERLKRVTRKNIDCQRGHVQLFQMVSKGKDYFHCSHCGIG